MGDGEVRMTRRRMTSTSSEEAWQQPHHHRVRWPSVSSPLHPYRVITECGLAGSRYRVQWVEEVVEVV